MSKDLNKGFEQKKAEFQSLKDVENALPDFAKNGITEFVMHERLQDKGRLVHFLNSVQKNCPELFLTVPVSVSVLDREIAELCSNLFCTLDIQLAGTSKPTKDGTVYLFDKKKYAGKVSMLNDMGLVFGFDMDWAVLQGDSIKLFRDRFDFALSLYPNHIDFFQLEDTEFSAKPTATFSSQDLRYVRDLAFACKTFYTCGRAVPWFLSVLTPLKIQPQKFFSDFAEWQRCNNCSFSSGFLPDLVKHAEIEKMQLNFLAEKYEEKHKESLFTVVKDVVRLNGAFARLAGEGENSVVELSYNPDDLFSPEVMDIHGFAENVLLEPCQVKVFAGNQGPDYKVI